MNASDPEPPTAPARPDQVTFIGAMTIILSAAYLVWMVSNALANPRHLPTNPLGVALLFAVPAAVLWFVLVQPALDLLAMRERGRRRMVRNWGIIAWGLAGFFGLVVVGGIIAMLAGADQWPPAFATPAWLPYLASPAGAAFAWLWLIGVADQVRRRLSAPEVVQAFAAAEGGVPSS